MERLRVTHPIRHEEGSAAMRPGTVGIEHEGWHAEARRRGAVVVVSVTAPDPRQALAALAASTSPMDCWFKDEVRRLTGEDLSALFA